MNLLKLASLAAAVGWLGCAQQISDNGDDTSSSGSGATTGLASYRFKAEIKISGAAPSGYSLPLIFNHGALVAAKKARADGTDLRVGFEESGAPAVELDRVLDPSAGWSTMSTLVWFRTPDKTVMGARYYLYYGHERPDPPHQDPTRVYDAWEGFKDNTLEDPSWHVTKLGMADGKFELKDGKLRVIGQSNDITGASDDGVFFNRQFSGDFVADVAIVGAGGSLGGPAKMGGLMVRQGTDLDAPFALVALQDLPRQRVSLARTSKGDKASGEQLPIEDKFPQFVQLSRLGNQVTTGYFDGNAWINMGMSVTMKELMDPVLLGVPFANISSDYGFTEIAWLRVYKRVSPPPGAQLGKEI